MHVVEIETTDAQPSDLSHMSVTKLVVVTIRHLPLIGPSSPQLQICNWIRSARRSFSEQRGRGAPGRVLWPALTSGQVKDNVLALLIFQHTCARHVMPVNRARRQAKGAYWGFVTCVRHVTGHHPGSCAHQQGR